MEGNGQVYKEKLDHLIYLACIMKKIKWQESYSFSSITQNVDTMPNILRYWAYNCKTMFNDEMIELTHSVFARSMKAWYKSFKRIHEVHESLITANVKFKAKNDKEKQYLH